MDNQLTTTTTRGHLMMQNWINQEFVQDALQNLGAWSSYITPQGAVRIECNDQQKDFIDESMASAMDVADYKWDDNGYPAHDA